MIYDHYSSQKGTGSREVLDRFIEIFAREGWLNRRIKIKYQDKLYWISCNKESFFAYQINENSGLGPGVPGWPVYIISKDYVYDESKIANLSRGELNGHNWLNIIDNRNFEVIAHAQLSR